MLQTNPQPGRGSAPRRPRRAAALIGLLVVQVLCVAFFLLDVTGDILGWAGIVDHATHLAIELAAVLALALGTALTVIEIRRVLSRQSRVEAQLRVASGAFLDLLDEHFDDWGLTPSEREVALLAIKGLSIADIARVRNTKEGTVKAQSNAIYSKAGVTGRPQLLSLFIDDLMGDGLVPAKPASAPAAERTSHPA